MSKQAHIISFQHHSSPEKGAIAIAEAGLHVPFEIKRVYWVYENQPDSVRGNHAHVYSEQVLVPVHGSLKVDLEDQVGNRFYFEVKGPHEGLYIPPMFWRVFYLQKESVCLSFSSHSFAEDDYIRDKNLFSQK